VEGRNHAISLLYEAAINPSLWPSALAAFADLTQCRDVMLSVIDKKRGKPRLFLSGCRIFTPDAMRAYLAHYYKADPLRRSAAIEKPAGTIILCHEYVSPDVVAKSELYHYQATASDFVRATQRIYCSTTMPSHLVLPVVP